MDSLVSHVKASIPSLSEMRLELQQRLSERRELKDFEEKLRFLDDEGKKIFQGYQEQALYRLVEAWLDSYESLWREEYLDVLQKRGWTHFKRAFYLSS